MNVKDIDNKISELVREKQLLNKSLKRTNDINEIKGIKKRIIELNVYFQTFFYFTIFTFFYIN